ncbi:MAG: hypothetical protein A3K10_15095 [Bacteroidetes bacterium RIFCSPLOWO2_12_FULL_31_6]|nr:MAG: hypothetical protein A3K10_15095 [Bacteroidetes bacterium RIFCSPLOWO2_12_FULL_31_6]
MSQIKFLLNYINYRFKSDNEHSIHSPFIYELYTNIIKDETHFYSYQNIESIRAKLLLSDVKIKIEDFGVGSTINKSNNRTIKDIAKHTLKSPKYGQLLFRLVNRFKPKTLLELGTSLGISTLYLAASSKNTKVTTVEGCPNTAKVAQVNFNKIGFKNIDLVNDSFEHFLPIYLAQNNLLDFVFFDGNHQKEATLNYFNLCLEKAHSESIFIFDDIHWSEGMTEAWEQIKKHPKVTSTIDLFFVGIVFFKTDLSNENFVLRF